MPYTLRKGRGSKPWKIVRTSDGAVVGSSTSRTRAMASIRARRAAEHGSKMRGRR